MTFIQKISIALIIALSLFWVRLLWLFLPMLSLLLVYFNFPQLNASWMRRSFILRGLISAIVVILVAILFRVFILEICYIPSASMEDELFPGDQILMNKLSYGPQLPRTPSQIPWLTTLFSIKTGPYADNSLWTYRRLPGLKKVARNDIVIFTKDHTEEDLYIKRCVGLPGDELIIEKGVITINKKEYADPATIKHRYTLWFTHEQTAETMLSALAPCDSTSINVKKTDASWEATLSAGELHRLKSAIGIDSVRIGNNSGHSGLSAVSPWIRAFNWTIDEMGPLIIPARGTTIELNHHNFLLYYRILQMHEHSAIRERNGVFFLNDTPIRQYTFKQNYYFLMGDNRATSIDSRYWGFVPEENIIGQASCVLFSDNDQLAGWSRFIKFL